MEKKFAESIRHLRKITAGYTASRVLFTASRFRLFDHLETPIGAPGLAKRLSLDPRATEILLDALAALGFLRKSNNRYRNSKISSVFLVSGKPYFQGDILDHHDNLWHRWSDLDGILKTGRPASGGRDHGSFIRGMHNLSVLRVAEVMSLIDLKGVRSVLDIGGGPGTYAVEFAKRGLDVVLFDMQETFDIAREYISSAREKGSITFRAGDFLADDIGKGYDLVLVSQIVHAYGIKDNMLLLRKIRKSLHPGGRVVVQEFLINDAHTAPVPGALFAVNMLVGTSAGRTYSPGEMARWLKATGFKVVRTSFHEDNVIIEARRVR